MSKQGLTLVLGLGESGLAMTGWLAREGHALRVADSRDNPPGLDQVRALAPAAETIFGPFSESLLEDVSLLAISPGLALDLPLVKLARARAIPVVGEIELFAQGLDQLGWRDRCKLIAITGTNGKTTTTALTGALCRAAGLDTEIAGNISPAALDALMKRADRGKGPDVWVLELSSFQLETIETLRIDAGAVLNLTDDHLDRHHSMAAYAAAKARLFSASAVQVFNRQDPWVKKMTVAGKPRLSFGLDTPQGEEDYGLDQGANLARGRQSILPCSALKLAGSHNIANALAAVALCDAIGLPREAVVEALSAFRGLPHRVEHVASRADGVDFYDDSKGTNVGATLAALQGLGRKVVLIAGGDGKGQDFRPLTEAFSRHARAVVLIGRDAARLAEETGGCGVPMLRAADMPQAVVLASQAALPGDAVLLSPACASLDMFRNYAHRAEVFVAAVRQLPGVSAP